MYLPDFTFSLTSFYLSNQPLFRFLLNIDSRQAELWYALTTWNQLAQICLYEWMCTTVVLCFIILSSSHYTHTLSNLEWARLVGEEWNVDGDSDNLLLPLFFNMSSTLSLSNQQLFSSACRWEWVRLFFVFLEQCGCSQVLLNDRYIVIFEPIRNSLSHRSERMSLVDPDRQQLTVG